MMTRIPIPQSENQFARTPSKLALSRVRVLALGVLVAMLPSVVLAAPGWFVVSTDTQSIRCGDQEIYYTIEEYQQGTVLMVEGTSGDYSKVRYPADLGVFVPAREAQQSESGTTIRLIVESQLRAASMLRGFEGSWSPVFEKPLAAGIEMKILEVITDSKDEVVGYRVLPPKPPAIDLYPIAYIQTDSIRAATKAEIAQHLASNKKTPKHRANKEMPKAQPQLMSQPPKIDRAEKQDADRKIPDTSTTSNNDTTGGTTGGTTGDTAGQSTPIDLREPINVPHAGVGHSDAGMPDDSPASIQPAPQPDSNPVLIENAVPQTTAPRFVNPGQAMTPAALEALEASFTKARSMSREQLDSALPELLAEFTRTRQAAGDDEALARPLDQRIEWIKIRIQTRDQRLAIAQALAQNDKQASALTAKIEKWNSSRVYSLVGRLMLSGVYTGEHLPLLYRLRGPDPITGIERTIGYIAPKPDQDLRRYLGSLVGVVGTPVHDDALSLVVLSPSRVDVMPGQ